MTTETITCSRNQLAEALDVTPKHIDNLFNAGVVVKQARGEYDIIKSCKNYVEFLRGSQSAEKLDLTQERTRLTKYQADKTKLELDLLRADALPLSICKLWFSSILTSVKSQLLALPSTISVDFPYIEKDDITKIDEMIRGILLQSSKTPMPQELYLRLKNHAGSFSDE